MNRTLILVNVTGLIIGISYGLHGPVLPIFAKNVIGASYSELGWIGLANFVPYMAIPLFVGALLDRFNNGYLLAAGAAVNSASVYLLSVAQSVPEIIGFRIITGVAHAFFWPPCESIISDESSGRDRVRNISQFTMFFVAGFMAGPLLGTALLDAQDVTYRALFQITAFILAAAIVTALMASKKRAARHRRFGLGSIGEIRRFPQVIILVVFCTASFGTVLSIYPAFLDDRGVSDTDVLYLYFVFGASRVASLALVGRLAARTGRTLVAATAAVSAGFAMSVMGGSVLVFGAALVLMGFGLSIFFPLTLEIVLSRTRREISGRIIGAYETVFGIGWAMGPTFAGPLAQSLGGDAPYIALCAAGICVTALAAASRKKLEPGRALD